MDTASNPNAATATHSQMRDEAPGQEPVIMAVNSPSKQKYSNLRIEIARRVYTDQNYSPHLLRLGVFIPTANFGSNACGAAVLAG